MNIGITVYGKNLNGKVSDKFKECNCLLIVTIGDHLADEASEIVQVTSIMNQENDSGLKLAQELIHYDCEAVITGELEQDAFDLIAEACITRYNGAGHQASIAIELMEKLELTLIRNLDGRDECNDTHHKH